MRIPKYRRHSTGIGFVEYRGKRTYFPGKYNSPESLAAYKKFVEALVQDAPPRQPRGDAPLRVAEALEQYLTVARSWRDRKGRVPAVKYHIERMSWFMITTHGGLPLEKFGPRALKDVRAKMLKASQVRRRKKVIDGKPRIVLEETGKLLTRGYINEQVGRIRRFMSWAVSEELVPAAVADALMHVEPLREADCTAPEGRRVMPAPSGDISLAISVASPPLAAMIVINQHSGMRPEELCTMTSARIDRSKPVWEYRPEHFKGEGAGLDRIVFLGPKCQAALAPFLDRDADEYLFSPKESVAWYAEQRRKKARKPVPQTRGTKTSRRLNDCFTPSSFRQSVQRCIKRAKAQHWFPYQLRHARGTDVRKKFGLEGAQVSLGHARADVTQMYAERDYELARQVAAQIG